MKKRKKNNQIEKFLNEVTEIAYYDLDECLGDEMEAFKTYLINRELIVVNEGKYTLWIDKEAVQKEINLNCFECTKIHPYGCCCGSPCEMSRKNIKRLKKHKNNIEEEMKKLDKKNYDQALQVGGLILRDGRINEYNERCALLAEHEGIGKCVVHKYALDKKIPIYDICPLSCLMYPLEILELITDDGRKVFVFTSVVDEYFSEEFGRWGSYKSLDVELRCVHKEKHNEVFKEEEYRPVYQPEKDELVLSIRSNRIAYKLLLTANSSYPRLHLSNLTKPSPAEPPMFCMLLRKHIASGRIISITQPLFERIVEIHIEATNELGDKEHKKLIIEIMGRHSNIILTKENYTILDSIKHISADKSSVRQVLPNKEYTYPPNQDKVSPLATDEETFISKLTALDAPLFKGLYFSYSGLSPIVANEICHRAHLSSDVLCKDVSTSAYKVLYTIFNEIMIQVKNNQLAPCSYIDTNTKQPMDFHSLPISLFDDYEKVTYDSPSLMIESYYHEKTNKFNISQKTADIKKLIHNFIDRTVRKKAIQEKAIEESSHSELYKMYGELITSYSYSIESGSESFTTINYYEEPFEEITIPLDSHLTAIENAQHYFKIYNKAKRTLVAAKEQLAIIDEDLHYLSSVLVSLDILQTAEDIEGLRQELTDMGYLKKRKQSKKKPQKNMMPYMQFKSSNGLPIYVGKNNYQNDALTMKFAKNTDMWLHIKDGPGSHVIIKIEHGQELDDVSLVEGAMLAAYFSKGKQGSNVAIDYTYRKFVKKVPNAKPGMVIYTDFKTMYVTPDESFVKQLSLEN